MDIVAGVDLGGSRIIKKKISAQEKFLIEGLCEYPSLSAEGAEDCLLQIEDGLSEAARRGGIPVTDIAAEGGDPPGAASADGILSARGSTNFIHPGWVGFDIRGRLAQQLGKPVSYLNDGNAAALW